MQYEQDYIMRLIKQVIRALIGTLLNKRTTEIYEMPANQIQKNGDDLLSRLLLLADAGKICEAENRLWEELTKETPEAFLMALEFYDHINGYDNNFLEQNNFSRDEIRQAVKEIADRMGNGAVVAALLMDSDEDQ